jgi:hypothetical protein
LCLPELFQGEIRGVFRSAAEGAEGRQQSSGFRRDREWGGGRRCHGEWVSSSGS